MVVNRMTESAGCISGAAASGRSRTTPSIFPLPQVGGGSGRGLLSPAKAESSGSIAPTLTLPRLGGGNYGAYVDWSATSSEASHRDSARSSQRRRRLPVLSGDVSANGLAGAPVQPACARPVRGGRYLLVGL